MNFRRLALRSAIALLFVGGVAKADLISYWDFNTLNIATAAAPGVGAVPSTIAATSGTGTLTLTGFGGIIDDFGGTTTNSANASIAGVSLSVVGGASGTPGNGTPIRFTTNLSAFQNPIITFATQRTGTGFTGNQLAYSTDGINFTDFGAAYVPAASYALQTFDLTAANVLDGASSVTFRITFNGATSNSGNNRIDNLQINATAAGGGTPAITPAFVTNINVPFATGTGAFGNVLLGATASKAVTLTNSGTAGITSITDNGPIAGYTLTPTSPITVSVAQGATTTTQIAVDTSTSGPKNGNVRYTPNGGVQSDPLTVSANVGTTNYGVAITASTPQGYVTPTATGLTGTVTGTAAVGSAPAQNTTAKILFYTNSTAGDSGKVSITMRTRTPGEASTTEQIETSPGVFASNVGGKESGYLISDVADVTGMIDSGTKTDVFVLQMSYNELLLGSFEEAGAATQKIFLASFNGTEWVNAVTLNQGAGNTPTFKLGAYASGDETTLGLWGVDTGNHVVWAVLDHNSEFAVVPEPSTLVLGGMAMLGFAGFGLRRRRINMKPA